MSYTTIIPGFEAFNADYTYLWPYGDPAGSLSGGSSQYRTLNTSSTKTGTKVQGWRDKINKGLNASSAYSRSGVFVVGAEPGDVVFTGTLKVPINHPPPPDPIVYAQWPARETMKGYANPIVAPGHLTVSENNANAAALTETYKKVLAAQRQLNASATVAELAETIRQFGRPFRSVVDLSHRHLNRLTKERRRLRGPIKRQKEDWADIVSSTYLEYAFGLAPLINDTKGIAEALVRWNLEGQDEILAPKKKAVGRGVDRADKSATTHFKGPLPYRYLSFTKNTKKFTESRVQYVVGLSATLQADFQSNERLIQLLGFSPQDWIPGIYEGIPWSWLVDYFFNVGNILEAACASTADVKWISKTVLKRTQEETNMVPNIESLKNYETNGVSNPAYQGHAGRATVVQQTMERTVPVTLGIPPLVFSFPNTASKFLNMAAVLLQRQKKVTSQWRF